MYNKNIKITWYYVKNSSVMWILWSLALVTKLQLIFRHFISIGFAISCLLVIYQSNDDWWTNAFALTESSPLASIPLIIWLKLLTYFFADVLCKRRPVKKDDGGKIVGGNDTTIQTYPYQAYLLLFDGRDYYQCGGSIISQYYIVTAAHCLARYVIF